MKDESMRDGGRSDCPINVSLEIIGDRWSLLILRDMIFANKRTYGELLESDERIATNILRDRLNNLVAHGLLTKEPDQTRPGRRFVYSLTEKAITLVPVLAALGHWAQGWYPVSPALAERSRTLFEGGQPAWHEMMERLRRDHIGDTSVAAG